MKKFALQAFIYEVQHQCEFADLAFQDIVSALHEGTADRVFLAAHTFPVAVGNISKLLWPAKRSCEARGYELRELLEVSDDSVLKSRAFRNHFEHFDECLDKWANSSKRKNFADSNIGLPVISVCVEGTKKLKAGMRVKVDGDAGVVYILEK